MTGYDSKRQMAADKVQEPVANSFEEYCKTLPTLWNTHISRTYAEQFFRAGQSAQPAQEPVGHFTGKFWNDDSHNRMVCEVACNAIPTAGAAIYTTPPAAQPAQEPVALVIDGFLIKSELPKEYTGHLYTTPPKRPWVGLTPEETSGFTQHEMTVVKYVSKVLQEKNT